MSWVPLRRLVLRTHRWGFQAWSCRHQWEGGGHAPKVALQLRFLDRLWSCLDAASTHACPMSPLGSGEVAMSLEEYELEIEDQC